MMVLSNRTTIERLWRKLLCWIASTLRAANADTSGLAMTVGASKLLRCHTSLRENVSDFMSRAFSKQSRHNITPEAYKSFILNKKCYS